MLVIGAMIHALVLTGWQGGLGRSLGSTAFGGASLSREEVEALARLPVEVRSPLRMSLATLLKCQPRIAAAFS